MELAGHRSASSRNCSIICGRSHTPTCLTCDPRRKLRISTMRREWLEKLLKGLRSTGFAKDLRLNSKRARPTVRKRLGSRYCLDAFSLKDLRNRISVKATQKITKAMQMVAACEAAQARRRRPKPRGPMPSAWTPCWPISPASAGRRSDDAPLLMVGTGNDETHLLVVMTAERGLCGGFNSSIARWRAPRHEALSPKARPSRSCASAQGR